MALSGSSFTFNEVISIFDIYLSLSVHKENSGRSRALFKARYFRLKGTFFLHPAIAPMGEQGEEGKVSAE
jgi:hypothetical protein